VYYFAIVWFNIATSHHLSLSLAEIDKKLIICRLSILVKKFVPEVASNRVTLPTTNGGRGERTWEQGCII